MNSAPVPVDDLTPSQQRAVIEAIKAADDSWLSQTVFRGQAGASWRSRHALSGLLRGTRLLVTVLPHGYFTGYWLF